MNTQQASVYTSTTFVFVDQNQTSLNILKQRAEEGGLMNIKIKHFQFNNTNLPEFIQDIKTNVGDIELGIGIEMSKFDGIMLNSFLIMCT